MLEVGKSVFKAKAERVIDIEDERRSQELKCWEMRNLHLEGNIAGVIAGVIFFNRSKVILSL